MGLYRADFHAQLIGDLLVEQAVGQQVQHPLLLRGEAGDAGQDLDIGVVVDGAVLIGRFAGEHPAGHLILKVEGFVRIEGFLGFFDEGTPRRPCP